MLFHETQRYRNPVVWLVLLALATFLLYGTFQQVVLEQPFGENPAPDGGLISLALLGLVLIAIFAVMRMDTQVNQEGIFMRVFPWQFQYRKIEWGRFQSAEIKRLPLFSLQAGVIGKTYRIQGRRAVVVTLNDGAQFQLGTQRPNELLSAIRAGKYPQQER